MHETEEQLEAKYGSKYTATLAAMETHLDTLIRTAVQRSVTQEQEQKMAASIRRMITTDLETASAGVELHSPLLSSVNTSVKSFLMEDEEESQDMGDLIADSITALLDYDKEKDLQLHLVEKGREVFRSNNLGIPLGIRCHLWEAELSKRIQNSDSTKKLNKSNAKFASLGREVLQHFSHWPGLKYYDDSGGDCQLVVTKVLTQFPTYRSWQVFWTVPLLEVLCGEDKLSHRAEDEEFHDMLSVRLAIMEDNFKLEREAIFQAVSDIDDILKKEDFEYFEHLKRPLKDLGNVNEKDFDEEMICLDAKSCAKVMKDITKSKSQNLQDSTKRIFEENGTAILIRQWLHHGFVDILSRNCLLYVWDLFFLHSWDIEVQKKVVLSLLMLLRPWIIRCQNYRRIRNTFIIEPSRIYCSDLRKMFQHIMNAGDFQQCPQNTNLKVRIVEQQKPLWEEMNIKIRRDSLVKKFEPQHLTFTDVIGKISSKFQRKDSVSSVESSESEPEDEEPWLKLWIPFNNEYSKTVPSNLPKPNETVDCYIDALRYLPQNISVAKLSATLVDLTSKSSKTLSGTILSDLTAFSRLPTFNHKMDVNSSSLKTAVYIQVFGVNSTTGEVLNVGSAFVPLFKEDSFLYGGYQLPVRRVRTDVEFFDLLEAFDKFDKVPSCTILVRLLPHSDDFKPGLWYEGGYYNNEEYQATDTDLKLYKTYYHDKGFRLDTVKNSVSKLMKKSEPSKEEVNKFLLEKFSDTNNSKQLDIAHFNRFNPEHGFKLSMDKLFGLGNKWDNKYFQVLAEIVDLNSPDKPLARLLSQNFKMKSAVRAPVWEDDLHPVILPSLHNIVVLGKVFLFTLTLSG